MLIDRHIVYLLWTNGFVSIPGLGAFTVVNNSATVEDEAISAPSLTVSFDTTIDSVGGDALITSVSRQKGISYQEAKTIVENDVNELRCDLSRGKKVNIYDMGMLSVDDRTGMTVFDYSGHFYTSSWLDNIVVEPLQMGATDPSKVKNDDIYGEQRRSFVRSLQRTASSAAAIAVFALLAFIFSQLPIHRNAPIQIASMGIENTVAPPVEDLMAATACDASEPVLVLLLNTPADGTAPAKQRRDKTLTAEKKSILGRYCLIVASLASKKDAERYISANSTEEMPLSLLDSDGRWRVYVLSASAKDEIETMAQNINVYERYPLAWIYRR